MEKQLSDLVERLRAALGERLISVVLYGSAAMEDWQENMSDLNILCAVSQLSPVELGQCEPIFRWWKENGNPSPLLLTADEVRGSTDCFPIEFHDMQNHRRILYGSDLIKGLEIDWSFYRAQVEHELRAKQIRLRQKAAEVLSTPAKLTALLADSVSTFCVLGRHALLLSRGNPRYKKAEIVADLEIAMSRKLEGITGVLALRSKATQPAGVDATMLFGKYLEEVSALVRFVDALEK